MKAWEVVDVVVKEEEEGGACGWATKNDAWREYIGCWLSSAPPAGTQRVGFAVVLPALFSAPGGLWGRGWEYFYLFCIAGTKKGARGFLGLAGVALIYTTEYGREYKVLTGSQEDWIVQI